MTAPSTQVTTLLTQFGLTTAAEELVPRLTQAGHPEAMPVLLEVFEAEAEARRQRRVARLRRGARLPPGKTLLDTDGCRRRSCSSSRHWTGAFLETATNVLAFGLPAVMMPTSPEGFRAGALLRDPLPRRPSRMPSAEHPRSSLADLAGRKQASLICRSILLTGRSFLPAPGAHPLDRPRSRATLKARTRVSVQGLSRPVRSPGDVPEAVEVAVKRVATPRPCSVVDVHRHPWRSNVPAKPPRNRSRFAGRCRRTGSRFSASRRGSRSCDDGGGPPVWPERAPPRADAWRGGSADSQVVLGGRQGEVPRFAERRGRGAAGELRMGGGDRPAGRAHAGRGRGGGVDAPLRAPWTRCRRGD